MELSPLTAISPIDGRYHDKTRELTRFYSEEALFKYRVQVEIEYFIALCKLPLPGLEEVNNKHFEKLRDIYKNFGVEEAAAIKQIEKTTNHDVKATEYFVKENLEKIGLAKYKEFVHFGLTSQDINNTALPLMMKDAHRELLLPALEELTDELNTRSYKWRDISMLARTHGQPASPTKLGKEIFVFCERLENQLNMLKEVPFSGKFGGATGAMNAHVVAYPDIDWEIFANNFVKKSLKIHRQKTTTQIEHYDYLAAHFHGLMRINTILIDLCRDVWTYVSMDYFKQKIKAGEVGSSAMPHKVNPIDFENAEGNLGMANAILHHLSDKLPVSRLQRDLTDSTVTRNVGTPIAHMMISIASIRKGLDKLLLNEDKIAADLEANWAVVAEGIQTILRRENYPNPYEALKALTRTNEKMTETSMRNFILGLEVSDNIKEELLAIRPENYTGFKLV
jgi:adenylosuccinate lyase